MGHGFLDISFEGRFGENVNGGRDNRERSDEALCLVFCKEYVCLYLQWKMDPLLHERHWRCSGSCSNSSAIRKAGSRKCACVDKDKDRK